MTLPISNYIRILYFYGLGTLGYLGAAGQLYTDFIPFIYSSIFLERTALASRVYSLCPLKISTDSRMRFSIKSSLSSDMI